MFLFIQNYQIMKNKIALLLSGKLGFDLLKDISKYNDIEFVATDRSSLEIIDFVKSKKIPLFIGNPRNSKLSDFIGVVESELLLSINYLFLVEIDLIQKFKFPVNIHGSLLPKYRGRTPHVWAIINSEKETGVTAHIIDVECDTGDIILQKKINIGFNDTGFSILEKFTAIYPKVVRKIINLYATNSIKTVAQDHSLASFYSKRSPKDGQINWDWDKERIRNWVRAQSFPYPGAFAFFENEKIIIDKVSFGEYVYENSIVNGTVMEIQPSISIKTANGSIIIEKIRNSKLEFSKNIILS